MINVLLQGYWDDWVNETCSTTCDKGFLNQTRKCIKEDPSAQDCDGESARTVECNLGICPGMSIFFRKVCKIINIK